MTTTFAALNVSASISPGAAPSSVYANLAPKRVEVEVVGAARDLLVDGEADADRSVRRAGIPLQVRDRGHDLGDAGLVVGPEQRRAVGA